MSHLQDAQSNEPQALAAPAFDLLPGTLPEHKEMTRLLRRLRRDEPVRQIADACLAGEEVSPEAVETLLEELGRPVARRWRIRMVAAWALGRARLTPEQREEAAETLSAILSNRLPEASSAIKRCARRAVIESLLLAFALIVVAVVFLGDLEFPLPLEALVVGVIASLVFLTSMFASVMVPLSLMRQTGSTNEVRLAAVTALGRLGAPQGAGALTGALMDANLNIRQSALRALRHVLPKLTFDHYGQLDADAVPNLCRVLGLRNLFGCRKSAEPTGEEEELHLMFLEALEKVGDGRAVPFVERVTHMGWTSPLKETAKRILPILQARKQREDAHDMLLRGAAMPADPPGTLLRPVEAGYETPPAQLLRATSEAEDKPHSEKE